MPRIGRTLYSGIAGTAFAGIGITVWTETATPATDWALWFPFLQCLVCQAAITAATVGSLPHRHGTDAVVRYLVLRSSSELLPGGLGSLRRAATRPGTLLISKG